MKEIVQRIRDLFKGVDDNETDPEGHVQGVEVLEEAKDVGEMAKLVKKLNEANKKLELLREELVEADRAIEECDAMTEEQVGEMRGAYRGCLCAERCVGRGCRSETAMQSAWGGNK